MRNSPADNESRPYRIILGNSSEKVEIRTNLSPDECFQRLQNLASPAIIHRSSELITVNSRMIASNQYGFEVQFKTLKSHGRGYAVRAEASGTFSWDQATNVTIIQYEITRISKKSGKILFGVLVELIGIMILSGLLHLEFWIQFLMPITIVALIAFLFWLTRFNDRHKLQYFISRVLNTS